METETVYRIKALRDIPESDVVKGDIGGYVSSPHILSHDGNSWIAYGATVIGNVTVKDNAQITEKAIVMCLFEESHIIISDDVQVSDEAEVLMVTNKGERDPKLLSRIKNSAIICEKAVVMNAILIADEAVIEGRALLSSNNNVLGGSLIQDTAIIRHGATIVNSCIGGKAVVAVDSKIHDVHYMGYHLYDSNGIKETTSTGAEATLPNGQKADSAGSIGDTVISEGDSEKMVLNSYLHEIKAKIAEYETDIVKIIQYPLMTDRTDAYTATMVTALNKANRVALSSDIPAFEKAIEDLEVKFLAAESNAVKMAGTLLSVEDAKKTTTAKKLLNMAADEASTEHEKKTAFVQAFKVLEGVITVPEVAIDAFRTKVGLKELEMFS